MSHTPGPWTIDHLSYGWCIRGPHLVALAKVYNLAALVDEPLDHGDATAEEMAANARLICAAPELLNALESLVTLRNGPRDAAYRAAKPLAWEQAEEAIAKARGES